MWKFEEVLLDIGAVVVVVVVVDVAAADGDGEGDVIDSRKSIEEMSQYLTLDSVVETQMPFMSWKVKKKYFRVSNSADQRHKSSTFSWNVARWSQKT